MYTYSKHEAENDRNCRLVMIESFWLSVLASTVPYFRGSTTKCRWFLRTGYYIGKR